VKPACAPQVPTRVVYLDRTAMPGEGGSSAVATYDFAPEACAGATPRVHLLYRPGHYDVLYLAPPVPAASA
jgi:ubiquitin thioesterase protein OTUB1